MQGLTAAHHDTQRDNNEAAREPGYAQATGRFRWWRQLPEVPEEAFLSPLGYSIRGALRAADDHRARDCTARELRRGTLMTR
jgi:hypothetical protein